MTSKKEQPTAAISKEPTAAILLVGDEILRGQVQDSNAHYMARRLQEQGVQLLRIEIVGDHIQTIAETTRRLSKSHDHLFISGGVGPTHDDVTMEGVARAFDVSLMFHPELQNILEEWHGSPVKNTFRRLSMVPQNARIIPLEGHFPSLAVENTFVLPGVPRLLKTKFDAILKALNLHATPQKTLAFITRQNELQMAEDLRQVARTLAPKVTVGSYPQRIAHGRHLVRVTLTSRDTEALQQAKKTLLENLPHLKPE